MSPQRPSLRRGWCPGLAAPDGDRRWPARAPASARRRADRRRTRAPSRRGRAAIRQRPSRHHVPRQSPDPRPDAETPPAPGRRPRSEPASSNAHATSRPIGVTIGSPLAGLDPQRPVRRVALAVAIERSGGRLRGPADEIRHRRRRREAPFPSTPSPPICGSSRPRRRPASSSRSRSRPLPTPLIAEGERGGRLEG